MGHVYAWVGNTKWVKEREESIEAGNLQRTGCVASLSAG